MVKSFLYRLFPFFWTMNPKVFDVVVVGAGIEGSAAAYQCVKTNKRTLLLEQFALPHTRGSSHGGSRITCFAQTKEHHQRMSKEAYLMWETLEAETNTELIRETGMILVSDDPIEGYSELILQAMKVSEYFFTELTLDERIRRFPQFIHNASSGSYFYQKAGYIKANKALRSFQDQVVRLGGTLQDEEKVMKITPGTLVTVKTDRNEYNARSLILTPGPWAPKILGELGLNVPLKVQRICHLFWTENTPGMYSAVPVFNDLGTHGINCSGVPSHEYPGLMKVLTWTTVPISSPDLRDSTVDSRDIEETRKYVQEHFPGLNAEDGPAVAEACMYTETPDRDFILDVHPSYSNIAIGCGFSGHGFQFAPIVGKLLCQLAGGDTPSVDISACRMTRFDSSSFETQTSCE